jgi:hypothetical protein
MFGRRIAEIKYDGRKSTRLQQQIRRAQCLIEARPRLAFQRSRF